MKHITVCGNSNDSSLLLYAMLCNSLDTSWVTYDRKTSTAKALNTRHNSCTLNKNDILHYGHEPNQFNKEILYVIAMEDDYYEDDYYNRVKDIENNDNVIVINKDEIVNNAEKVRKLICKTFKISLKGKGFTKINNKKLPKEIEKELLEIKG